MIAVRRVAIAMMCGFVFMLSGPVFAQSDSRISSPSANDIHEFTRLLADERVQEWLLQQAEETEATIVPEAPGVREQMDALVIAHKVVSRHWCARGLDWARRLNWYKRVGVSKSPTTGECKA